MTETELIEQAKQGHAGAIQALYQQYAPRVYSVIRRLTADDTLAADCSQNAWIQAIRALPEFRGDARFATWLHRIAVNSALQGRRSQLRAVAREEPLAEVDVLPSHSESGDALLKRRLERALEKLPGGMREVLVLHDVEGFTHEEIGEQLGIAPGTSKSQLFKARARMRVLLHPAVRLMEGEHVCNT
jgi:RNA polymerase sigma-70 factor (ECF subfamily)